MALIITLIHTNIDLFSQKSLISCAYAIVFFQKDMPAAPTHVTEMRQTAGELVVSKISLNFDGFSALSEVDFVAKPGKVHAITGENGAGKSSLAKVLAGVYRPTSGTLSLNGNSLRLNSPKEGIKHGIALIHQEPMPPERSHHSRKPLLRAPSSHASRHSELEESERIKPKSTERIRSQPQYP